jgi:hypothetical protein
LPICLCEPEQVEEFCFALVLWMSVVEQVFGNLSVVDSSIPDIWDVSHLASRQPPDVGTCEAYNARKWLCEFDCVMLTVTPGMNDCPNGTLWQHLALCSSECVSFTTLSSGIGLSDTSFSSGLL